MSFTAPRVVPARPDPSVKPSTHRGNPHRGDVRSEGDPGGQVLPGTLASSPTLPIASNTGDVPVTSSDQLVAALGAAGMTISRTIADRILGVGVPAATSVQAGMVIGTGESGTRASIRLLSSGWRERLLLLSTTRLLSPH